jgi:hypothetical protein
VLYNNENKNGQRNFDHLYFASYKMSIDGWLYLIKWGDHRKHHKPIYKIGNINDFNRKINEYPTYWQIICVTPEVNNKKYERELIKEFKKGIWD